MIRQPVLFLFVGGLQYVVDTALFILLITVSLGTLPANVTSRATAAAIGFLLNRYLTFGQRKDTLVRFGGSLLRFLILFMVMTLISSVSMLLLEYLWGDSRQSRIFAKLTVEAVLAVASFLVSRSWVFKN